MAAPKINELLTSYNFTQKNDTSRIKYIVIHYVGALGGAEANCKYYAAAPRKSSAHYFVGFDGEIWQSVGDEDIAWHCGAKKYKHPECRNDNSIGVELCVKKEDTSHLGAQDMDWYFTDATEIAAALLVRHLMDQYGVPIQNVLRHYDVTGKICPNPYVLQEDKWHTFLGVLESKKPTEAEPLLTAITGKAIATVSQMRAYLISKNSSVAQSVLDMLPHYLQEGAAENIRGDIAFAQSCLETGNFTFAGSAVELCQNNFCGLGVTKRGLQGNCFDTPQLGIRAQIQHLKAYASEEQLQQECIDPRFKYVTRGCAPYVEQLGIPDNPTGKGWAAGDGYGGKILKILSAMLIEQTEIIEPSTQEYMINTTCDILNIRAGAGTMYSVVGQICEIDTKKKYTIVEVKNGWGKLKSGAGWIKLSHTKRIS